MAQLERFVSYTLSGLLPDGSRITINTIPPHTATLVESDGTFSEQETFTPVEYDLVMVLFSSYPYYAPREELLYAYSGRSVEDCRARIQQAVEADNMDLVMKDVRNILSRTRLKLHALGVSAVAVLELGYLLKPYVEKKGKHT